MTENNIKTPENNSAQAKKPDQSANPSVKKRVPVHKQRAYDYAGLDLNFKKYHYHWVNCSDEGNNVARYLKGGYTHVMDEKNVPIKRSQGRYAAGCQYLMKLPIEIYLADQEEKLEEPRSIERDMLSDGYTAGQTSSQLSSNYMVGRMRITEDHVDPTERKS